MPSPHSTTLSFMNDDQYATEASKLEDFPDFFACVELPLWVLHFPQYFLDDDDRASADAHPADLVPPLRQQHVSVSKCRFIQSNYRNPKRFDIKIVEATKIEWCSEISCTHVRMRRRVRFCLSVHLVE
jgi:hypothetical protein